MKNVSFFLTVVFAIVACATPTRGRIGSVGTEFTSNAEPFENPYVADGLVAMFDGEWNAGWGQHKQNLTKRMASASPPSSEVG